MYREFILRRLEEKANLQYHENKDLLAEIQSLKIFLAWIDILEDSLSRNAISVGDITFDYSLNTLFIGAKPIKFHNFAEGLFKFLYEVSKE